VVGVSFDILLEVFANSPPAILITLGFVLILFGMSTNNEKMTNAGWVFFGMGITLQILWLLIKARH
jgi:hypothetical protein